MIPPKAVVLAIDDDPIYLEVVSTLLMNEGLEVLTANDPVQGLELVRSRRPDIVLTDFSMPRLTGMQVLDWVRAFDPSIEVAIVTGRFSADLAREAMRRGAVDFVSKPVMMTLLRQWVNRRLSAIRRQNFSTGWNGGQAIAEPCPEPMFPG